MSWYLRTYNIKHNNLYTSDIKWSIHVNGVDIPSAGVPYLNVMRWGSSNVLDMIILLRLDMDDHFLRTTAVCFAFALFPQTSCLWKESPSAKANF